MSSWGLGLYGALRNFARIICNNVVLELKDDSPQGKLLGIQVDMQYEK